MLYLDVTQLLHWPGNLTGIPRVMNELATRFVTEEDVQLVIWTPETNSYNLVENTTALQNRGVKIDYVREVEGEPGAVENAAGFTFKVLRRLDREGIPTGPLKKMVGEQAVKAKRPAFTSEDILFVMWGEQQSEEFISGLKQLKQDTGLSLMQISYDMLPLVTPQYSGHSTDAMRTYTAEIFPLTDLVIVISESAKQDLSAWMDEQGLEKPTIEVFRLGDDFAVTKPKKPSDPVFIGSGLKGDDYVLCVGTVEARKNHTLLYYTYKLAASKGIELPKLVVAGRKGWRTDDIISLINDDPETKDNILLLHDIDDAEMAWLYKHSKFGILASFYEGWGLQIAESIYHGRPFIASRTSSTPEIAGDLIEYFNPTSTDECLKQMQKYSDEATLKEAEKRIKKYKPTTWDDTFKQVKSQIKEARK